MFGEVPMGKGKVSKALKKSVKNADRLARLIKNQNQQIQKQTDKLLKDFKKGIRR